MRCLLAIVLCLFAAPASADGATSALALVEAARAQVGVTLIYDPSYQQIAYPMGDVPVERGVCSDVVIRAFRAIGIDLQQEVHRDMAHHFAAYPKAWGLSVPDANIDHRRVPNLATWFTRRGYTLQASQDAAEYHPGDIVAWALGNGRPHIGIVSDQRSEDGARPLVIHNIGWGAREEDVLFAYRITGHFRAF
ncbi:MAG TPA: DUF1287 domain-containing protein [Dongiaceae bacterium]|jgi:hypothetical protein|nr:DUF1287 domain-containing protein [Dongiaceae bacterium]